MGDESLERNGFVDLQVNGYLGVDFSAPGLTVDDVGRVTRALKERGTPVFCPTVITSPLEVYEKNLPVLVEAMEDDSLAPHLLGIHLEGPFISPLDGARGAHPAAHVRKPDRELSRHLLELADHRVSIVSLAPDQEGATELIEEITKAGICVCLAHHLADASVLDSACQAGAKASTHLGNGIPNHLPRHANPLIRQLVEDRLAASLITDGHHLPPQFIDLALRCKGVERLLVVSDAAPIAGQAPGRYETLGQEVVLEENGKLWNPAGDHLVGSSASMLDCMNFLAGLELLEEDELWRLGLDNPLRLIGAELDGRALETGPRVHFEDGRFILTD